MSLHQLCAWHSSGLGAALPGLSQLYAGEKLVLSLLVDFYWEVPAAAPDGCWRLWLWDPRSWCQAQSENKGFPATPFGSRYCSGEREDRVVGRRGGYLGGVGEGENEVMDGQGQRRRRT